VAAKDEDNADGKSDDSLDGELVAEVTNVDKRKTWPVQVEESPSQWMPPAKQEKEPVKDAEAPPADTPVANADLAGDNARGGALKAAPAAPVVATKGRVGTPETYANRADTRNVGISTANGSSMGEKAKTKAIPFPFEGQGAAAEPGSLQQAATEQDERPDDAAGTASSPKQEYDKGLALYSGGRYGDAIERFDRTVSTAPRSSNYYGMALYYRGKAQLGEGRASEAVLSFRKVLSEQVAGVDRQLVEYNLATALLRIDPKDAEAERILARLMKGGGGGVSNDAATAYSRSFGGPDDESKPTKKAGKKAPNRKMKSSAPKVNDQLESYDTKVLAE
jgi:TolA-binding protein